MRTVEAVLLDNKSRFSNKAQRGAYLFLATLFVFSASLNLFFRNENNNFTLTFGLVQLVAALWTFYYGINAFSANSKLAARIALTDDEIILKKSFFRAGRSIPWSDVHTVDFQKYAVRFVLKNGEFTFQYSTSPQASKAAKQMLRKAANQRGIEVIDG